MRTNLWRACFVVAAVVMLIGGPQHPRGTMVQMLGDPRWVQAHVLMLIAFLFLLAGLTLYRRSNALPERTRLWLRFAQIATALEVVEMAVHTAAVVDHHHLATGAPTPVLNIHLGLSIAIYPLFAVAMVGLILAGMRERSLGSRWIGWLGIIGAIAHGLAAILVIAMQIGQAGILFPMFMLFALWMFFTGLWPVRAPITAAEFAA